MAMRWFKRAVLNREGDDPRQQAPQPPPPASTEGSTAAVPPSAPAPDPGMPALDLRGNPEARAKLEAILGRKLEPGTSERIEVSDDPELAARILGALGDLSSTGSASAQAGEADPESAVDPMARLREQVPERFRKALDQAPPEVAEALAAFGATGPAEVQIGEPVTISSTHVQVPGARKGSLEVRFDRDPYAPGDVVRGTIVALEEVKARQVEVALCYVEQSPGYVEEPVHDGGESLHRGTLAAGTEIPFELRLPEDALPNWDPAGMTRAQAGQGAQAAGLQVGLAGYGRLYWAVVVTCARRGLRSNRVERHPVPLTDDRSAWTGPRPSEEGARAEAETRDVHIALERSAVRRGEEVVLDVAVGEPDPSREGLRAGIVGEIHYDVETTSTNSEGATSTSRTTRIAVAHEEWAPIDASSPRTRLAFRIPADAPFSHGRARARKVGKRFTMSRSGLRRDQALSIVWKAVVVEERRMRRDPRAELPLQVQP